MIASSKEMLRRITRRGELPVFVFMLIFACSFGCDGSEETNGLNDDQVEMYADVTERTDRFEISGYIKSLNPSGFCQDLVSVLNINCLESEDSGAIKVEKTVNGVTDAALLNDLKWTSPTAIFISHTPLSPSNTEYSFLIKIYKNVNYKIIINSLYSCNDNGTKTEKNRTGCSGTSGIEAERTFEIDKTIESL